MTEVWVVVSLYDAYGEYWVKKISAWSTEELAQAEGERIKQRFAGDYGVDVYAISIDSDGTPTHPHTDWRQ